MPDRTALRIEAADKARRYRRRYIVKMMAVAVDVSGEMSWAELRRQVCLYGAALQIEEAEVDAVGGMYASELFT